MFQVAPIYYGRTICGNNLTEPIRVISDGRILVVDFGTNNEVTGRGFAALLIQVAGKKLLLVKFKPLIKFDSGFCQATL